MFGRGEFFCRRSGLLLWSSMTSLLLSHQVANHVVQALLNQKVSLPFCWLAWLS